jgi:hypothetical protein
LEVFQLGLQNYRVADTGRFDWFLLYRSYPANTTELVGSDVRGLSTDDHQLAL